MLKSTMLMSILFCLFIFTDVSHGQYQRNRNGNVSFYGKHGEFRRQAVQGVNGWNFYGKSGYQGHVTHPNKSGSANIYGKHNQYQGRVKSQGYHPYPSRKQLLKDNRFPAAHPKYKGSRGSGNSRYSPYAARFNKTHRPNAKENYMRQQGHRGYHSLWD